MNISMLLDMAAEGFDDRVLIGRADNGLTAPRLRELAVGGARLVRSADADAIVYLAVNGPALPVALFAAARAGVPLIPVNYRLGEQQLDALLANHPRALGIADPEHAEALRRAGLAVRSPEEWLTRAAEAPAAPGDEEPAPSPDSPAVLIYTSGTTSTPKGVVLRHHNLVSYVLGTVEFAGAGPDEAALVSVPPYHIAAVSNVLTNLYSGRRALSLDQFTPEGWLDLVRRQGVTNAMVVPTMLARIMDTDGLDRSVPSLRALAYGGARMPVRVIETALRAWPHVDFVNAYGLTETSSTITVLGPQEHRTAVASDDPAVRARLGSAGLPVPGVELEVRDASGAVVGPGGRGRSGCAATRCRGSTRGRVPRSTNAGSSTPVTRDGSMPTATSTSRAGPTTRSSAAPRTSRPPRSRTFCCVTRTCWTRSSSVSRTRSGASASRPWSWSGTARSSTPGTCGLRCGALCAARRRPSASPGGPNCPAPRPASSCAGTSSRP